VKVTNDAGSVIQEINSNITVTVRNAGSNAPGRGTLLPSQFQLLQGQRTLSENYSFAEPIVLVVRDDAGNAPGLTNSITIVPGPPAAIHLASSPSWLGGNKFATLTARLEDEFQNGVAGQAITFTRFSGLGILTPIDSLTDSSGIAHARFLSPRQPEHDHLRASAGVLYADLDIETSFVDPNAGGGTVTNYPNPFHPPGEGTTIAYKLDDNADVTLRIFTQTGDLVREEHFARGGTGGVTGLNAWSWNGLNGSGRAVSSGGYILLVEAHGQGQTLHVMRRKIAVVR